MRLSPQWTTITSHAFGARDVLLLQNAETGQAEVASFDDDGKVATLLTRPVGAGWSDVVSSNGFLLFYDYRTGRGTIYDLHYTFPFPESDTNKLSLDAWPVIGLSPGWTALVSNGRGIFFYNYATQEGATGAIILLRRPDFVTTDVIYRQDFLFNFRLQSRMSLFARCRNQIVMYTFDGVGLYATMHLDTDGDLTFTSDNPSGQTEDLPPYSHVVGMQDRLFFYDAFGGDGEVGLLTQEGVYIRLKTLQFSPWWSHVVATDYRVLFYRSSTGEAVTGYFDPAGDFVQQQTYF